MKKKGTEVYDNAQFFANYLKRRNRSNSPNTILEEPIIDELIAPLSGLKVLDLGCGDGLYGEKIVSQGAYSYYGVDASKNMIAASQKNLSGLERIQLEHEHLEKIDLPENTFDLALSRLVFHYIENLEKVFKKINKALIPEGKFVFSVEHPIITSNYESYHQGDRKGSWVVRSYFSETERANEWIGEKVVKYHKTIQTYFSLLKKTGFTIDSIRESKPEIDRFLDQKEFHRRSQVPLFLIFKAYKTSL